MDLGSAIKLLRLQKDLKQNAFAEICDISPTYLSQIENNLKLPNISMLQVIAKNLDIPLPILFFLSIDEKDIVLEKRKAFEIIAPSVKSMIGSFFSETKK
jgi:transcriptional regulator with XRE-family HTH domain